MRLNYAGRFWVSYLIFVAALLGALFYGLNAHAQEPATCTEGSSNSACLAWSKPTTDVAGNTLTGPVTVNIYAGKDGAAKSVLFSGVTGTSALHASLTPGVYCYEATAVHAGLESDRTGEVCKTISFSRPSEPAALTVD